MVDSNVVLFKNLKNSYVENNFEGLEIKKIRMDGWEQFKKNGLPPNPETSELWKYTNFSNLHNSEFNNPIKNYVGNEITKNIYLKKDSNTIFIIDGFFDEKISSFSDQIIVENSSDLKRLNFLSEKFGKIANNHENEMISLNSAFMQDPIFISAANSKETNNLNIIIVTTPYNSNFCSFPRVFVNFEENSRTNVLESYYNLSSEDSKNLTVPVIEYNLSEKSHVFHNRIQIDSGNSFYLQFDRILQDSASKFQSTSFSLSGLLSRYDIHSDLSGVNSECNFHGLYITNFNQHQENEISTTHSVESCSSDQMFKGILAGNSRAVFSGKVLVKKDAQKTRAFQKDFNFLLSRDCEIDTKPSLEIYADDVECSHGATAGNMDRNMLFYLQSRGIDQDMAMSMLIRGFAQEIIDEFGDDEIIQFLEKSIDDKIPVLEIDGIM